MAEIKNVSAVVLAAGLSQRMGSPKFALQIGTETFAELLLKQYLEFDCSEIVLVINSKDEPLFKSSGITNPALKLCINPNPELGRALSLHLGLQHISIGHHCFMSNVDNPFAPIELLEKLFKTVLPDAYTVPSCPKGKGHPILLGSQVADALRIRKPESDNIKIILKEFKQTIVNHCSEDILININNENDLSALKYRLKQ